MKLLFIIGGNLSKHSNAWPIFLYSPATQLSRQVGQEKKSEGPRNKAKRGESSINVSAGDGEIRDDTDKSVVNACFLSQHETRT